METDFEYDVAFSFTQRDEGLAQQLSDLLADRMKCFIYTDSQKDIAGRDGQEAFSDVYGRTARIVVVFYRKEWGGTKWTGVEMNSIKTRAFDNGYDFVLFIPTEPKPQTPPWLPKTRLYFSLERFGMDGAAATIESMVTQAGGRPKELTLLEHAAKSAREVAFKRKQDQFDGGDTGAKAAGQAFLDFGAALEAQSKAIKESIGTKLVYREVQEYRIVGIGPLNLVCIWRPRYSNSIEKIFLTVTYNKGLPGGIPGYWSIPDDHKVLLTKKFQYKLVRPDTAVYVSSSEGAREFTPEQLADHLLKGLLDSHAKIRD